ncbi:tRNA pseudouridine synthase A [Mucilaginibacter paludis DSM 18603]|uniref:tRNA pseudouridine synthase A n=2 Tax=Mucilaginibacter TaxID=423349 RepID=H1Y2Q4_9SPHI|nr:tRNA pseudouridine synthase A [Mucilaginibacter paludis DSM 18603]
MADTQRYFIELAYDGTNYHGWQIQHNAISVQQVLNKALSTLLRMPVETLGCGRTDTGVHAKQLYAHFDIGRQEQPIVDGPWSMDEGQQKKAQKRTIAHNPSSMDEEQPSIDNEQITSGNIPSTQAHGLPTVNDTLSTTNHGPSTTPSAANHGPSTMDHRPSTTNHGLSTTSSTTHHGPSTIDHGLPQKTRSLNALLPHDIAVKRIIPVHADAHARFDATLRSYEYHVHFEKDPFLNNLSWQLRDRPDVGLMNQAAQIVMEYTDFSCFSKSNTQVKTNNCKISRAEWVSNGDKLIFHISADRFLRNMVRAIVGTLMMVGKGDIKPEEVRRIIESKNRSNAGVSVPACGLYLTEVRYPYL